MTDCRKLNRDDETPDIGARCPRCNSVVRKALNSTIKDGVRRRYVICQQCGKQYFTVEMRQDYYEKMIELAKNSC